MVVRRKVWTKLQNPFVLVAQGFIIGGLMLLTTQGDAKVRPAHIAPPSVLQSF
jgi:hypothetical protein